MYLYLWKYLGTVSDFCHEGGGAVVIAKDEDSMKKLIATHKTLKISEKELRNKKVFKLSGKFPEEVIIFPDAGCC